MTTCGIRLLTAVGQVVDDVPQSAAMDRAITSVKLGENEQYHQKNRRESGDKDSRSRRSRFLSILNEVRYLIADFNESAVS